VAHERIEEVCDRAFTETFQDDPSVFVVRKARARVAILAPQTVLESRLAEQWGARLCASVVRVVASASNDDSVVRFENQAAFVSNFLSDLVAGTAWEHWYHGAFHGCRRLPDNETIFSVLIENADCLAEILHRLAKANALDAVLRALGEEGQRRLWMRTARFSSDSLSADAFRIFVHSAFALADALSLWTALRPAEQDYLDDYLAKQPASPQWTDPASLASAVTCVFRELLRDGWLSASCAFRPDTLAKLDAALASSYDWLDKTYLKNSFATLFSPSSPQKLAPSTLRPFLPTPAQLRLLGSLLSSIRSGSCPLDLCSSSPHAQLLRILASLGAAESSASPAATAMLESIVEAWLALRGADDRDSQLLNLRRGQLEFCLARLSPPEKSRLRPHLESVAEMGDAAIAVVEALLAQDHSVSQRRPLEIIPTACAGLFLLVRTVQDLRLFALLKESGFDSLEPLLVALAVRICGKATLPEGKFDSGAALWSGIPPEEYSARVKHLESLDIQCFRSNLAELVAAQRLVGPCAGEEFTSEPLAIDLPAEVANSLDFVAASLLHGWARWLPGLSASSAGFLLEKFVRRSGTLYLYPDRVDVNLSPGPLDAILKMAGYFSDSPAASWLGNRFVRFRATF
jgi:hypothetical protein